MRRPRLITRGWVLALIIAIAEIALVYTAAARLPGF
jgi:hypothetical protein